MNRRPLALLAVIPLFAVLVLTQEHPQHNSRIEMTPQWEKLKSLVGEWDGYADDNGQKIPTHISIRMTGDGSAVMHWMDAGGPHEMVTMFHMDQSDLLATHYCAAHNQPRFRAKPPAEPNQISFEFKDGTNIRPGDGYMRQLVISFEDADHHVETWGYDANGTIHNAKFYLARVRQPAK